MFDINKFRTPDSVNTPGYFWLWNGVLEEEKLFAQLEDMAASGAKNLCIHPMPPEFRVTMMTKLAPGYLSEEFFRIYRKVVDKCAELGMCCYLYDEGGWPSGGACGRVLAAAPDDFKRYWLELDTASGSVVKKEAPFNPYASNMPDNLLPAATEKFIDLTHKSYGKYISSHFGKTVLFTFTDEPELGCCDPAKLPWTPGIEEEFIKRKGYDIKPFLTEILAAGCSPIPRATALKRLDYYDVCSELFVERYLYPVREWCRNNNLLSGGHFNGEDEWFLPGMLKYGSLMRSLRALDAPGIDVIWRQLYPGKRLHSFPKLASSAAAQTGNRYCIAETFNIYGSGLTPEAMRFVIDYLFTCGINIFILACYPYDTSDGNMEGCRPHGGLIDPLHEYMDILHRHISRLSCVFTNYAPEVCTALFFDQRSMWMGGKKSEYSAVNQQTVAEKLLDSYCDFDYIDDDVLRDGRAVNGKLVYGSKVYERIIFPDDAELSMEAAANLENLKAAGVPVLHSRETELIPPLLHTTAPAGKFRIRKLTNGTETFYFVMNITASTVTASFSATEQKEVFCCSPESGELYLQPNARPGIWEHTFAPYSPALFLLSSNTPPALPAPPAPGREIMCLSGGWLAAPVQQTFVGRNDYQLKKINAEFVPAEPGDWANFAGKDFSGKVIYKTEFEWTSPPGIYYLDLGKVNYAAQVKINGRDAGRTFFPPHILMLESHMLQPGRNTLEISVSNTLANAIVPEEILQRWHKDLPYMTYYEMTQRDFEKESTPSGLYGPVRILHAQKE